MLTKEKWHVKNQTKTKQTKKNKLHVNTIDRISPDVIWCI